LSTALAAAAYAFCRGGKAGRLRESAPQQDIPLPDNLEANHQVRNVLQKYVQLAATEEVTPGTRALIENWLILRAASLNEDNIISGAAETAEALDLALSHPATLEIIMANELGFPDGFDDSSAWGYFNTQTAVGHKLPAHDLEYKQFILLRRLSRELSAANPKLIGELVTLGMKHDDVNIGEIITRLKLTLRNFIGETNAANTGELLNAAG
jgi:hypothetical protein